MQVGCGVIIHARGDGERPLWRAGSFAAVLARGGCAAVAEDAHWLSGTQN